MQTKGTRAKGEKGANSWLDVPERSFPPLNRAVLTVKPINLWIHVSVLCVSLFQRGTKERGVCGIPRYLAGLVSLCFFFDPLSLRKI